MNSEAALGTEVMFNGRSLKTDYPPPEDDASPPPEDDASPPPEDDADSPPPEDADADSPPPEDADADSPPPEDADADSPPPEDADASSPPPEDADAGPPPPENADAGPPPPEDADSDAPSPPDSDAPSQPDSDAPSPPDSDASSPPDSDAPSPPDSDSPSPPDSDAPPPPPADLVCQPFSDDTVAAALQSWAAPWADAASTSSPDDAALSPFCDAAAAFQPTLATSANCKQYAQYMYGMITSGYLSTPDDGSTDLVYAPFDGSLEAYTTVDSVSTTAFCRLVSANQAAAAASTTATATLASLDMMFGALRCDPSLPCCPGHGIAPAPSQCYAADASPSTSTCESAASCMVVEDSCAKYTTASTCNAASNCKFMAMPFAVKSLLYPNAQSTGTYSVCVNPTLQSTCAALRDIDQCSATPGCGVSPSCSPSDGWYTASGTDTCSEPQVGDAASTDASCATRTPLLNNGAAFAGGCKAAVECVTKPSADPCLAIKDPFTCNTQSGNCVFIPDGTLNGLYSGTCRQTHDSCNAYGVDDCTTIDGCSTINSCATDRCDPSDACCPLDPLTCAFRPECDDSGFECLPAYDDCGIAETQADCSIANRTHCAWNSAASVCHIADLARHPCSAAAAMKSVDSCLAVADYTLGNPETRTDKKGAFLCQVASTCTSKCIACQDAVQTLLQLSTPSDSVTDADALGTAWLAFCGTDLVNDGLVEDYMCAQIWIYIINSEQGMFFKRPAAIAQALSLCPDAESGSTCTITITSTAGTALTGPTSTCTREGVELETATWVGANSPYLPTQAAPTGYCRGDDECSTGQVCALYGGSLPDEYDCYCDQDDGSDSCNQFGQCVDFCASSSTVDTLNVVNWRLNNTLAGVCTADADCAITGHVCDTAFPGGTTLLTCDPTSGNFLAGPPSGVCRPSAEPQLTSAIFDPSLAYIAVSLEYNIQDDSFPCQEVFDAATAALIGSDASCESYGSDDPGVLYIYMSGAWTVTTGSTLTVDPAQTRLVDAVFAKPITGSVTVGSGCGVSDFEGNVGTGIVGVAADCQAPEAVAIAPTTVFTPCPGAAAGTPFNLDGSMSSDYSGKAIATYEWSYLGSDSNAFSDAISTQAGKATVTIPGAVLASLDAGTYQFQLVVTNFMGITSQPSTGTITLVAGSYAPSFSIDGLPSQTFALSTAGLSLSTLLDPTSICGGYNLALEWGFAASSKTFSLGSFKSLSNLVMLGSDLLQAGAVTGTTYNLVLNGQLLDASGVPSYPTPVTAAVAVTFSKSPLSASISGPSGWVPNTQRVVLNVKAVDPDNTKGARFIYIWSCVREDAQPCFSDATKAGTRSANGTWAFDAINLGTNLTHVFSVTVNSTDGSNRAATASIAISPQHFESTRPVPTGTVSLSCVGGPCPSKLNPTQPVALIMSMDPQFAGATIHWSSPTAKSVPTFDGSYENSQFTLLDSAFPKGVSSVTVQADITMCYPEGDCNTGRVVERLDMARPPICTSPTGCATLSVTSTAFPDASVVVTATGMSSPDKGVTIKSYKFGYVLYNADGSATEYSKATTSSPSYTFTGLTVGTFSFWVKGIDSQDGSIKAYTANNVTVTMGSSSKRRSLLDSCVSATSMMTKLTSSDLAVSGMATNIIQRWGDFASLLNTAACIIPSLSAADKTTLCNLLGGSGGYVASINTSVKLTETDTFAKAAVPAVPTAKLASPSFLNCPSYAAICTNISAMHQNFLRATTQANKASDNTTCYAFASALTYCANPATASGASGRRSRSLLDAATVATAQTLYSSYDSEALAVENNVAPGLPYYTYNDPNKVFSFAFALETPSGLSGYTEKVGSASTTMDTGYATACRSGAISPCPATVVFSLYSTSATPTLLNAWSYTSVVPAGATLISTSAVTVNFAGAIKATNYRVCPTTSANTQPMPSCGVSVTIPVANYSTNSAMLTACLRIVVGATTPAWTADTTFVTGSYDATANTITCKSAAIGTFIVVQYPAPPPPPPSPNPPPPPRPPSPPPPVSSPAPGSSPIASPSPVAGASPVDSSSPVDSPSPAAGSSPITPASPSENPSGNTGDVPRPPSPAALPSPSPVVSSPSNGGDSSPSSALSDNQKQVALTFAGANIATLNANANTLAQFKASVVSSTVSYLVNTLKYDAATTNAIVQSLTGAKRMRSLLQGSGVTATALVTLPPGTNAADTSSAMAGFVSAANSGNVFPQSFLSTYGITGVSGTVVNTGDNAAPTDSPAPSSNKNAVILGTTLTLIPAAIIAAVVGFLVMRRRSAAIINPGAPRGIASPAPATEAGGPWPALAPEGAAEPMPEAAPAAAANGQHSPSAV